MSMGLDRFWHWARSWAAINQKVKPLPAPLGHHRRAAERAAMALRIAYYFPVYWMSRELLEWQDIARPQFPDLLWPVAWLSLFSLDEAGPLLASGALCGVVLGAVLSQYRWARVVSCLALLEFLSLKFSLGKIHHLMHGWLLLLCVCAWLPSGWHFPEKLTRGKRHELLLIYTTAQLLVAMTYSLAGTGKVLGVMYQLLRGEVTALHPSSLARHIAARLLETNDHTLWGPWLIELGGLLWPLMLATLYLQVFAVLFVLRPRIHRLLGLGLVVFHVLAPTSLAIDFTPAVMLCGILYLSSAVAPETSPPQEWLRDLPLIGPMLLRSLKEVGNRTKPAQFRRVRFRAPPSEPPLAREAKQ